MGRRLHSKRDEMDGYGQSGGGGLANSKQLLLLLLLPLQLPKRDLSSPLFPLLMSAFASPSARPNDARSFARKQPRWMGAASGVDE